MKGLECLSIFEPSALVSKGDSIEKQWKTVLFLWLMGEAENF